ncbi:MAG: hypothetical protein ACI4WG_06455 [Erysipelotrichaceae bacterium]
MKKFFVIMIILLLCGCGNVHFHEYTEANYQQSATCLECGQTKGDVLTPDFVKHEMADFVGLNEVIPYQTSTSNQQEETVSSQGTVEFKNYYQFETDDNHSSEKGYMWNHLELELIFFDENCMEFGADYSIFLADYYDDIKFKDTYQFDQDKKINTFTVNYYGVDYQNCQLEISIKNNQWEKRSGEYRIVTTVIVNVLLPENYDGFVIGVRNSDVSHYESDYLYQYYDADNFISFRMGVSQ